ncbi:DUF1836 domain-containing protein [Streptococcus hillyeri]|uniref:DUF1836 domain-containing protein n=1 Tax=Streptococcus hillyeri TaxID=2282420 RepID=A0A3L9E094_9STRE|nr:DUF1836 domain-containing protein [Streptococcus hillyeri]RLY05399.1 DUF1836 domain-containing protein [Streptococcus hillyeri]
MKQIPYWSELPDIALYLDQVLLMVNDLAQIKTNPDDKGLTASMVNNYVKHGYVDKPTKKKYEKKQFARLIAITFLKHVFSIQEIAQALNLLQQSYSSQELYDDFASYMNGSEKEVPELIATACEALKLYYNARLLTLKLEEETYGKNAKTQ